MRGIVTIGDLRLGLSFIFTCCKLNFETLQNARDSVLVCGNLKKMQIIGEPCLLLPFAAFHEPFPCFKGHSDNLGEYAYLFLNARGQGNLGPIRRRIASDVDYLHKQE